MEPAHIELPDGRGVVEGECDARFRAVLDAFVANFHARDELGASVCVTAGGETVVDLWGGRRADGTPWERDTICVLYSCTKGVTAICAHVLAHRGLLDVEAPVAEYWPEFAGQGKEAATVRMLLDHSAGVPTWREPLKPRACLDWDYLVERLAAEEPFWKPGTRNGYHMISFGWTVGEVVCRVSGMSLGTFLDREVAGPLGAEFWIGLPQELEPRLSATIPYVRPKGTPLDAFQLAIVQDRDSIQALQMKRGTDFNANDRACRAAEVGAAGGIGNARGLARLYAPLANGGALDGVRLSDADGIARMGRVSTATNEDATLMLPTRFALGFMKSMDNRRAPEGRRYSAIFSEAAFGHVGAGGSVGFADPALGMSFGYAMNRAGAGILMNERGQSLVDAACAALGAPR